MLSGALELRRPQTPLSDGVVSLRPWGLGDVDAIVSAIDGDGEISRWLEEIPQPYRAEDARAWVERTRSAWQEGTTGAFAVCDAAGGGPLGAVGLHVADSEQRVVEIGYWAARAGRGRGITTRATRLVAVWALESLGAQRVQLRAEAANTPSQRVAEKVGFVREGVLRSYRFNPRLGRRMDFVIYSLLPGELN